MLKTLAACGVAVAMAPPATASDAAHPAVVELFQSQGCSSCPPANANLLALSDRPDVLALSFQVTYWDQLGWKDTFAQQKFTDRQWDYAHALRHADVFTPQVVVNGRGDTVGARRGEIEQAIARNDRGMSGPRIDIAGTKVTVSGAGGAGQVWLVRYDPRIVQVAIRAGENSGRTLPHKNIVRQLVRLGSWNGGAASFSLPSGPAELKTAVLVQSGPGGPILAAARG